MCVCVDWVCVRVCNEVCVCGGGGGGWCLGKEAGGQARRKRGMGRVGRWRGLSGGGVSARPRPTILTFPRPLYAMRAVSAPWALV
eukprot:scaffold22278_cov79-Isochrysis_galbana.AAC.1